MRLRLRLNFHLDIHLDNTFRQTANSTMAQTPQQLTSLRLPQAPPPARLADDRQSSMSSPPKKRLKIGTRRAATDKSQPLDTEQIARQWRELIKKILQNVYLLAPNDPRCDQDTKQKMIANKDATDRQKKSPTTIRNAGNTHTTDVHEPLVDVLRTMKKLCTLDRGHEVLEAFYKTQPDNGDFKAYAPVFSQQFHRQLKEPIPQYRTWDIAQIDRLVEENQQLADDRDKYRAAFRKTQEQLADTQQQLVAMQKRLKDSGPELVATPTMENDRPAAHPTKGPWYINWGTQTQWSATVDQAKVKEELNRQQKKKEDRLKALDSVRLSKLDLAKRLQQEAAELAQQQADERARKIEVPRSKHF